MPQTNHNFTMGVPHTDGPGRLGMGYSEANPYFEERNYTISGITRDSTGAPLDGCIVKLFNTATDILVASAISDGSGNYSFTVDKTQTWYIVTYKTGSPDVAGTSVNTLVAV